MLDLRLTDSQRSDFDADGYLRLEGLLDDGEVRLLADVTEVELATEGALMGRRDGGGAVTELSVRNELTDDVFSALVRARPLVRAVEAVLGGEVYHYHHKVMAKRPRGGGAWEWHQDYGYWYRNGCLFPHMASLFVAIDGATRENGCLEVLRGSHHLGRLEHVKVGDQTAADPERMVEVERRLDAVACELAPGDALLFHCNLLHRSGRNDSDRPRRSLIACYNRASNDPYLEHHHPRYTPLEIGDPGRVAELGRDQLARLRAASGDRRG